MSALRATRLLLRPHTAADADDVARYAGDIDVARMIRRIPHPYARQDALDWFARCAATSDETNFAITRDGAYLGACGYMFSPDRSAAEIGYWLAKPFWGHGYATEAARALIRHGFGPLALERITISHMTDNPASARVIAKCGFHRDGTARVHCLARQAEVDLVTYVMTRSQAAALPWYQAA